MVKEYGTALRRLWTGRCSVYICKRKVNGENGRDEAYEAMLFGDEPCRLSFSSLASTSESDTAARIQQSTKLFLSPDLEIPAGSKIVVAQNGKTQTYTRSGAPAFYSSHQEITLAPFERYA